MSKQRQLLQDEITTLNDELVINKKLEAELLAEGGATQSTLDKLIKEQNERQKSLIELNDKLAAAKVDLDKAKDAAAQLNLLKKVTDAMKLRDQLKTNQDNIQADIDAVSAQLAALKLTPQ